MTETWIPVSPKDYDEWGEVLDDPQDVEERKSQGSFISPYDIPDGLWLTHDSGERRFTIRLRYVAEEEEAQQKETHDPAIHLWFGKHSKRIIRVEIERHVLPEWSELRAAFSIGTPARANHFVARKVISSFWGRLVDKTQETPSATAS